MPAPTEISQLSQVAPALDTDVLLLLRPTDHSQAATGTDYGILRNDLVTFPIISDDGTTRHELLASTTTTTLKTTDLGSSAHVDEVFAVGTNAIESGIVWDDLAGGAGQWVFGSEAGSPVISASLSNSLITVQSLLFHPGDFLISANDGTRTYAISASGELLATVTSDATPANQGGLSINAGAGSAGSALGAATTSHAATWQMTADEVDGPSATVELDNQPVLLLLPSSVTLSPAAIPTSDPHVAGQVFVLGTALQVSAG